MMAILQRPLQVL